MGETVIADFVAHVADETIGDGQSVKGRVLLSQRRLVLATDDHRTSIPLSRVFDVAVGHVPPDVRSFFNDSVTVAYRKGGQRRAAVVEGDHGTIEKFTLVLFRALVDGTDVSVIHPARVGGRVQSETPEPATVGLRERSLALRTAETTVAVDLETVSSFRRTSRELDDTTRPTVEVRHLSGDAVVLTVVAFDTQRTLNIVGRYLRREYDDIHAELRDLDLTDEAIEALVTLYSTGGNVDLSDLLDADPSRVTMVLNGLKEDGLVVDGPDGVQLTTRGRIVATTRLEGVNR